MHVRKYLSDKYLVYIGIAHDLAKAPGQRVYETFYNVATKVWRRYVEHIAIRLKVFRSGLVMSDDEMMNVCNYTIDCDVQLCSTRRTVRFGCPWFPTP